jgi:hypothetical protein
MSDELQHKITGLLEVAGNDPVTAPRLGVLLAAHRQELTAALDDYKTEGRALAWRGEASEPALARSNDRIVRARLRLRDGLRALLTRTDAPAGLADTERVLPCGAPPDPPRRNPDLHAVSGVVLPFGWTTIHPCATLRP